MAGRRLGSHQGRELRGQGPLIAVDTNLLVYSHRRDSPFHEQALGCVTSLAEGSSEWAIPWPCLSEFHAIVTHPRIYSPPTAPAAAVDQIDAWLESPTLTLLSESAGHWSVLRVMLRKGRVTGPLAHDARIAALCMSQGVKQLWSADRDFSRFVGLVVRNPLIA